MGLHSLCIYQVLFRCANLGERVKGVLSMLEGRAKDMKTFTGKHQGKRELRIWLKWKDNINEVLKDRSGIRTGFVRLTIRANGGLLLK